MSLHTNEYYKQMIKKFAKKSPCLKNCLRAFLVGGLLCFLGQWLFFLYDRLLSDERAAGTLVTVSLIFLSAALTAVGVFDRIARFAGAGTLLPVTGFANAMVSPAMDAKSEGYVMGVGNKLFTVCGPVIAYGILASVLYGAILWIVSLF
jgi:stage V sporulation protein AC